MQSDIPYVTLDVTLNGTGMSVLAILKQNAERELLENMASSKEYLNFILNQFFGLDGISYRTMMGEYIIYYNGKIIGGIYDDRFLVKPVRSAVAMLPDAKTELPYESAKEMLLVEDVDNRELLQDLLKAMYKELLEPKKR